MELDKVTAEIRPRTQWEAIDLGIRLTSEHALSLIKGWMASVYPLALLILALFGQSIGWGIFLIWWLKPVWERVALHPLSRNLFGEHPTWRETMKVLPRELLKNKGLVLTGVGLALLGWWIHAGPDDEAGARGVSPLAGLYWLAVIGLLFYRSGLLRSLALPVRYLEGLDRARYRTRLKTLSYRSSGPALALTILCLLMELLLFGSQIFFAILMIPQGMGLDEMIWLAISEGEFGLLPAWMGWAAAFFYLNALSVVAWFYTGAGFGLYVNTRTWTEGWDIELKFKGLGRRLAIIALGLLVLGGTARLEANEEARRILDREEFDVQTRGVYEEQEKDDQSQKSPARNYSGGIFAGVGEALFWVIMALGVAGIIWVVVSNAHFFKKDGRANGEKKRPKVRTVAGLNVEPENLPERLVVTARRLWEEGRHQQALSLLYRGAISSLVFRQVVEIEESDTELDCLRRVAAKGEVAHASYFETLTKAWISQAYARRTPDEQTAAILWGQWPFEERGRS